MPNQTPPHVATLAAALLASSTAPLVLLDGDLNVIAVSASFCRAFQIKSADVVGRPILEMDDGKWNLPRLRSLLEVTASGDIEIEAYELDLEGDGQESRRLVLNARKLDYDDVDNVRLLLTVSDVTDARLREKIDDLLKEKAILLQEVQHRVANSLQIIASVILQKARKVQSKDARSQLAEAHQRVMSVAALQEELSASTPADVELRTYFDGLCRSIGASMIRDHNQISLDVNADGSSVPTDVSVSLGLIVTELVINALKHAFPGLRRGKIIVGYQSSGADWTLSVSDDGVGMNQGPGKAEPGLGSNIVEALANQLRAVVEVADTAPGTRVSVVHLQTADSDADWHKAAVAV